MSKCQAEKCSPHNLTTLSPQSCDPRAQGPAGSTPRKGSDPNPQGSPTFFFSFFFSAFFLARSSSATSSCAFFSASCRRNSLSQDTSGVGSLS